MALRQKVLVSQGGDVIVEPFPVAANGIGSAEYPFRAFLKVSTAGAVLSANPVVGPAGPIVSVVRNGAGDYTVTLAAIVDVAAANVAIQISSNTANIFVTAVVTSATVITVNGRSDAGAATDANFTLAVLVLS